MGRADSKLIYLKCMRMTDELFLFRKYHCQHEVKWRSEFIEDKLTRHCTIGRIVHFEIKLDYVNGTYTSVTYSSASFST